MKAFVVFSALIVAAFAASEDYCYKDSVVACQRTLKTSGELTSCDARYGGIESLMPDLQAYTNTHITRSFQYMLMWTHFANYEKNRKGFENVFKKLSDKKWEEAIHLIKYITKRGGKMKFNQFKKDTVCDENQVFELDEINALAKSLDIEKNLAVEAFRIHAEGTRKREDLHDPELSYYLEKYFISKQSKIIRFLAGVITDLQRVLPTKDRSLGLELIDDTLKSADVV